MSKGKSGPVSTRLTDPAATALLSPYTYTSKSKLAARMGAYFHRMLINACNFLVMCSCVGTLIYFRPRGSSANFCSMIIAFFLEPEIQSAID